MNKQKLAHNLYARVRLWPTARRRTVDGIELPRIDDDWIVMRVGQDGVVELHNIRTDHVAKLGTDRIHHFDHEPHRERAGLRHGCLELRVQLVLCGPRIHYLPLQNFRPRRVPGTITRRTARTVAQRNP
jgi:hypothetical protein